MKTLMFICSMAFLSGCAGPMMQERYAPCDAYSGGCQPMVKMNVWE